MPVTTALLLVLAGPAESPTVQRPSEEPVVEAAPSEPVAAEPAPVGAEPAPVEAVEVAPTAAPSPGPVSGETPFGTESPPVAGRQRPPSERAPQDRAWRRDYVRVPPPSSRGTGFLVASVAVYATAVVVQLVDATVYRNVGSGLADRVLLLTSVTLVPFGANLRGRHDAYYDAAVGLKRRPAKRFIGAGVGLVLLGGLATVASEAMWWQCAIGDEGPYHTGGTSEFEEFSNRRRRPCNYGAARAVVDVGSASLGAGLGMLVWGLRYRHDSRIYARARFALRPRADRNSVGVGLKGSF